MSELKPCPFCGTAPINRKSIPGTLCCANESCVFCFFDITEKEWNTRPSLWVRFDKEKPNKTGRYLVHHGDEAIILWWFDDGKSTNYLWGDVTAWQPLPPHHTEKESE